MSGARSRVLPHGITLALTTAAWLVAARARAQPEGAPPVQQASSASRAQATQQAQGARLTLAQAVARATARNPAAAQAQVEIARAEALAAQARAASYPTLVANATFSRLDADRELAGRVIAGANQLSANLTLSVPLFAPRAWAAGRRADEASELARSGHDEVRRQLAQAVGRAYLTVVAQRRVVEASERARDTAVAHLEFARGRRAGGLGNRLDEVRAGQEVASAEAQLQGALAGLARGREALGVLVGDEGPVDAAAGLDGAVDAELAAPPDDEPQPNGSASGASEPSPAPASSPAVALSATPVPDLSARADLRLFARRAQVAERATRDAWAEYAPTLTAVGLPFYQNPPTITQPLLGWQAQLVLSVPIYDGGLRRGIVDERNAAAQGAREALAGAARQARSEVRVAREALRRAELASAAARASARLSAEALELAATAYRAGASTNLELVDAERRARDAATVAAVADDGARQARLELLVALGKFP